MKNVIIKTMKYLILLKLLLINITVKCFWLWKWSHCKSKVSNNEEKVEENEIDVT